MESKSQGDYNKVLPSSKNNTCPVCPCKQGKPPTPIIQNVATVKTKKKKKER